MNEESLIRQLKARRYQGRKPPRSLYHATPFRLKVGTHLRPRISAFTVVHSQVPHAIWMSSTTRRSREIAARIVSDLRTGIPGYAGTSCGPVAPDLRLVEGCWIYRVRPTGPLMHEWRATWTTVFPVRILEEFDRWGSPEKNKLEARPAPSIPEVVWRALTEDFFWYPPAVGKLFRDLWRGYLWAKRARHGENNHGEKLDDSVDLLRATQVLEAIPQKTLVSEIMSLFDRARDEHHGRQLLVEYLRRCARRASLEAAVSQEASRHKWRRKLTRDRRYKRERFDWRREL